MGKKPIIVRPKKSRRTPLDRAATKPRIQVTERDWLVLEELARHRFLTAEQVNRLAFRTPARRVRRRLRLLFDAGIIDRVAVVSQPTRGVPSHLHHLTEQGARLIASHLGEPVQAPSTQSRSLRFVVHHVTACNFYVLLSEALALRNSQRAAAGLGGEYKIVQWQHEWQLKTPQPAGPARAERVAIIDPASGSKTRELTFLPDAFLEVALPDESSLFFFYECDLSTHPLRVWRDRALLYAQYARPEAGLFRRRFGRGTRDTFRLLVVCPRDYRGRSRCDNILSTIEETIGPTTIVLGTTLPELKSPVLSAGGQGRARDQAPIASDSILKPIWRQVGCDKRTALLPPVVTRP